MGAIRGRVPEVVPPLGGWRPLHCAATPVDERDSYVKVISDFKTYGGQVRTLSHGIALCIELLLFGVAADYFFRNGESWSRLVAFWPTLALAVLVMFIALVIMKREDRAGRKGSHVSEICEDVVIAPVFEELLCRAPLIILFASFDSLAIAGTLIYAAIFGIMHYDNPVHMDVPGTNGPLSDETFRWLKKELGGTDDDRATYTALSNLYRDVQSKKRAYVYQTFGSGVFLGLIAILTGTIWSAVLIHASWNLMVCWRLARANA